jgi:hypothetical protein
MGIRTGGFLEETMKKHEVPQDRGFSDGVREIAYAVDENGRYVRVKTQGWDPKTVANDQAWEVIDAEVAEEIRLVRAGKRSPLAYHMARNLMDVGLLADYVGLPRWRVRRHLKPKVFRKLSGDLLKRYADVFDLSVDALREIPEPSPAPSRENDTEKD